MLAAGRAQQRRGPEEEQLMEATRMEQRLLRDCAQHLDDLAGAMLDGDVPLSPLLISALKSAASKGFPPPVPILSGAWLAAAEKGHARCISLILDTCKQRPAALKQLLETGDGRGRTALMLASRTAGPGHLECMRLLLEHSPNAQVQQDRGTRENALMCAALCNSAAAVQLLLAHSPEQQVAAGGWTGFSALMTAALEGRTACLKLLLAHSPDQQVVAEDLHGCNALTYAAGGGRVSFLQLLLAHSPDAQLAVEPAPGVDNALSAAAGFLLEAKARSSADGAVASDHQRDLAAGRECVELLLAHGAQLPDCVSEEVRGVVWSIVKEAVRRARVPDMANAAVVGLAWRLWRGAARDQPKGRRAGPEQVLPYQKLLARTPDLAPVEGVD